MTCSVDWLTCSVDWLTQCQDNVTEWDIGSLCLVGQHYQVTMTTHECTLLQVGTHPI